MENKETKTRKWRWGVNRWIVLLTIILGVVFANIYPPIRPFIDVAPEKITHAPLFSLPVIGDFYLTNTLVAMLLGDVIVIGIALAVRNATKGGNLVLSGLSGGIEMLVETLYNLTESTAGKHAKKIFPWFASFFIFILVANLIELIPGVDSIGRFEEHHGEGYSILQIIPGLSALVNQGSQGNYHIVPFVRVLSTDLNFTVALALMSVFMTQIIGIQAQGIGYFSKFVNTKTLFSKPFFGVMDLLVGLLELISELAKILSFSFRLFGVIFAGSVLLFLVGSMVPVFMQSFILMFEFFMGAIQAIVFGMLTMIFMSQATAGHGEHEEHGEA